MSGRFYEKNRKRKKMKKDESRSLRGLKKSYKHKEKVYMQAKKTYTQAGLLLVMLRDDLNKVDEQMAEIEKNK